MRKYPLKAGVLTWNPFAQASKWGKTQGWPAAGEQHKADPALPVEGARNLMHTGQSSPRSPNRAQVLFTALRLLLSPSTDKDPEKELFFSQVPKGEDLADIPSLPCFFKTLPLYDFNDRYSEAK